MPPKKSNNSKPKNDSKTDQESSNKDKAGKGSAVKLRHILCEKQSKILEALEKLKAGKSFNDVATEYSEDKAKQGGSLGWFTKIALRGHAFEQTAFTIAVSSSSKPIYSDIIKTKFGYHIIMVEEKK